MCNVTLTAYELNISYFDALGGDALDVALHVRRYLSSQAIMLALPGVPGIYFHSLVGTSNDHKGVEDVGCAPYT
jgi:sucrose phosphorylase